MYLQSTKKNIVTVFHSVKVARLGGLFEGVLVLNFGQ